MYWILNFLPLLMHILIVLYPQTVPVRWSGFSIAWVLLLSPIYLLIVNFHYIKKEKISYVCSGICMLLVVTLRVIIGMVKHKIQYGVFFGDVPGVLYLIEFLVPATIVGLGVLLRCAIKES